MDRFRQASLAVGVALIAATAISLDSTPALAQDEGAPCSTGSPHVCEIITTCVVKAVVFIVPVYNIPITRCVGWEETMSYWKPVPAPPATTPTGTEPDDPQTPPGGA